MFRRNSGEKTEKKKLSKKNLKRLLGIFRFMMPYRWTFAAGLVSLFFSSTILLAFPYFTGKLIDTSMGDADWILSDINKISLALVAILAVQGTFSFLRIYFFARVNECAMADIRKALYAQYLYLPIGFYDRRRAGELMSRISADVGLLQNTFSTTLSELIRQLAILFFGTLILFATNYQLTLFMLLTFPVLVIVGMVFGRFIRTLSKKTQDALAKANIIVEETLQSVSTVKAFTNETFERKRYGSALDGVVKVALRAANYRGIFISFIIFALFGGIVLVLWFGSRLVAEGTISVGDLTSFVIYTMFIGGSIGGLGDIYGSLQKAVGASDRVQEILEQPTEISAENRADGAPSDQNASPQNTAEQNASAQKSQEPFDANKPHTETKPDNISAPLHLPKGNILLKNVCFSYPTRPEIQVLRGIDMDIKPGEKVALVGYSGAGKSTLTQLLLRFYRINSGVFQLDGKSIYDYPLHNYRKQLGIVPQEVILFGGTIRENIAYGKPTASEAEILQAAHSANAMEFIAKFPEQLSTPVGERGVKLSGGQRQRIAIARAILKDPAILILDEATSSLDAEAENAVQKALDKLMENRTTIIIAHRLATIRNVDRIYVIDKGKIYESGTHTQLAKAEKGIYSGLLKLQSDKQKQKKEAF